MIRAGIVGCGKIADQHATKIQRMQDCRLVGVCDSEELMAKQLYERYHVDSYYSDLEKFLEHAKPDVVHITTPAQSHYEIGKKCLLSGCHVYIEKPFTLHYSEAQDLIALAEKNRLKLTVGHNLQFSHAMNRMRNLVHEGYLGGLPIHMESYYFYDFGDERYAKALLGDKEHWVRKLPGKLLHNLISHGISKIAEFIQTDEPTVIVHGSASPFLRRLGENDLIDELRVIVSDERGTSAYFTFSSQIRPVMRHFRIYGSKNAIIVDDDNQTVIKVPGKKYKSFLNQFVPPLDYARQYLANFRFNIMRFLRKDFHSDYGMKHLIEAFYCAIAESCPLPLTFKEILITAKIMDEIFVQLNNENHETADHGIVRSAEPAKR